MKFIMKLLIHIGKRMVHKLNKIVAFVNSNKNLYKVLEKRYNLITNKRKFMKNNRI